MTVFHSWELINLYQNTQEINFHTNIYVHDCIALVETLLIIKFHHTNTAYDFIFVKRSICFIYIYIYNTYKDGLSLIHATKHSHYIVKLNKCINSLQMY